MKVTTGAPIFLVSACASAEEFVAAFRRYADRTGLFIPIAEPFSVEVDPSGRRLAVGPHRSKYRQINFRSLFESDFVEGHAHLSLTKRKNSIVEKKSR